MKQRLRKRTQKTAPQEGLSRPSELLRNVMETSGGDIEKLVYKAKERYDRSVSQERLCCCGWCWYSPLALQSCQM